MRRVYLLAVPAALCLAVSCGFTLDFDKLQKEKPDASVIAGAGGTAGATADIGGTAGTIPGAGGTAGSTAGSGGAAGAGGAPGVPLDQLASAMATAMCANLNACYVSAVRLLIHDEDCHALFTSVLDEQYVAPIQQSVARGTITYDPLRAEQCVANLVQGTRQSPPACANVNALIEDCKLALGNLGTANEPCGQRYECQRGLTCRLEGGCPGTCRAYGQVGTPCQADTECDPTQALHCQQSTADAGTTDAGTAGTCQPYIAINASCATQDCEPGGYCIGNVCRRLTEVFTLSETFACFGNNLLCNPGLSCEFSGIPLLSAAACVTQKQALAACRLALLGECPQDYYCNAGLLNLTPGQCVASPTENQPCATGGEQTVYLSAPCHAGLTCVNGICKPMRHLGQACEADAQCYSGACRAGSDAGGLVCVSPGCG